MAKKTFLFLLLFSISLLGRAGWAEWQKTIFHVHTKFSDGLLSPQKLEYQIQLRHPDVKNIVFTDHDRTLFESPPQSFAGSKYLELRKLCVNTENPALFAGCELTIQYLSEGRRYESHCLIPYLNDELFRILAEYNGWTNDKDAQWGQGRYWADDSYFAQYPKAILSQAYQDGIPIVLAHPFELNELELTLQKAKVASQLPLASIVQVVLEREGSKKPVDEKNKSLLKKAKEAAIKPIKDLYDWSSTMGLLAVDLPRENIIYKYVSPSIEIVEQSIPKGSLVYIDLFNAYGHEKSLNREFQLAKTLEKRGYKVAFMTSADWHGITNKVINEWLPISYDKVVKTQDVVEDILLSTLTAWPDQLGHLNFFYPYFRNGYQNGTSTTAVEDYWFSEVSPLPSKETYSGIPVLKISLNKEATKDDELKIAFVQDFELAKPLVTFSLKKGDRVINYDLSKVFTDDGKEHSVCPILLKKTMTAGFVPIAASSPIRFKNVEKANLYFAVVLDDSLSMDAIDYASGLSKIERSRRGVDEMLAIAPEDVSMSLVMYRAQAVTISLPKPVKKINRSEYWQRSSAEDGTAIGLGIKAGLQSLPAGGRRAIILLTDGQNNRPGLEEAIAQAAAERVPIFCIGYRAEGDEPDFATLFKISQETGGFIYYADTESVGQIFQRILATITKESMLLSLQDRLSRKGNRYAFRVSADIKSLRATIAPTEDTLISAELISPLNQRYAFSGSPLQVAIPEPAAGVWKIEASASREAVAMISAIGRGSFSANFVNLPPLIPAETDINLYVAVSGNNLPSKVDVQIKQPETNLAEALLGINKLNLSLRPLTKRGDYQVYSGKFSVEKKGPYFLTAKIDADGKSQTLSTSFYVGEIAIKKHELFLNDLLVVIFADLIKEIFSKE